MSDQQRDMESLLNTWAGDDEFRSVTIFKGCVELRHQGLFVQAFRSRRHFVLHFGQVPDDRLSENRVICGTAEQPATVGETILAALELWEKLYSGYPKPGEGEAAE